MAYNITKDKNPMAVNILKLKRYNFNFFKLEEIILFEYLIVNGKRFKKAFYHSAATIEKETGIKRSKLNTILKKLVTIGFISTEIQGFPKVTYFSIHFDWIVENLNNIFTNQGADEDNFKQLSTTFYGEMISKQEAEPTKTDSIKDTKFLAFHEAFDDALLEVKVRFGVNTKNLDYTVPELKRAYDHYDGTSIIDYLLIFF